jgi:hypothetical protein
VHNHQATPLLPHQPTLFDQFCVHLADRIAVNLVAPLQFADTGHHLTNGNFTCADPEDDLLA